VDGLDVSDSGYPLVAKGGIRFSYVGKEGAAERPRRIRKKIDALAGFIRRGLIKTDELIEAHGLIETDGLIGADGGAAGARFEERPRLYRIAAGGDAMLARGVGKILFTEGAAAVLGETAALVRGADLSIVNLEGVLSDRGEEAEKTYTFRFDPRTAAVLKDAGFDAVLLANNHAFDFGLTGFLDSLDHLEKAGLAVLGAGRERAAAAAPFITGEASFPVRVFGIASFGPERNGWDGGAFAADVNKPGMLHAAGGGAELIKSLLSGDGPAGSDGAPLDIVFFHGGVEYVDYPDGATRALYTELINAGADLVIGTHPHVEQGFEWVRGKPVFWSLGDYIFDEMDDTPGGDKGIFVVLSYPLPARPGRGAKRPAYIEVYPLFMKGPRTLISPEKQLDRFLILTRELAKNEVQL
jgi:poly-gamma-glutamate synthesis protein (capsule biosynthesis protein)